MAGKTTTRKKTKVVKTVNAKELKAWLRGIQEFQPQDWVPTVEQWDAICERIFLLDEGETASNPPHNHQYDTVYVDETQYASQTAFVPVNDYPVQPQNLPQSRLATVATSSSPTASGIVPVTSQHEVIEAGAKSSFG